MITGFTTLNPATGIRTAVRLPAATHGHWAVHQNYKTGDWYIHWGYRINGGTHYEKPWPSHDGFRTKKDADAVKRELRAAGVEGWNGPPAAPEVP